MMRIAPTEAVSSPLSPSIGIASRLGIHRKIPAGPGLPQRTTDSPRKGRRAKPCPNNQSLTVEQILLAWSRLGVSSRRMRFHFLPYVSHGRSAHRVSSPPWLSRQPHSGARAESSAGHDTRQMIQGTGVARCIAAKTLYIYAAAFANNAVSIFK